MPNTKIKVCNITMHYWPITGGQEVYIDNLIKVFQKNDLKVSVLQRNTGKNKDGVFFVPQLPRDLYLYKFLNNHAWFVFNICLRLSKSFLKKQDILISHYPFHYPALRWHKKVIVLSHGVLWPDHPNTFFDKFHKRKALEVKNSKVFTVANDTHYLREMGYNIQPGQGFFTEVFENTWLIPNCVDTQYFTRKNEISKEKIILVPRNVRYDRGVHIAIEAFSFFLKKHPDFIMMIAGRVGGEYFEYCKKIIANWELTSKVIFLGHQTQEQLVELYNRASVSIIPSLEKEGTSLSALESMSCGTATIVTNVAGLKDLPAIKAEPNPQAVAEKMNSVLRDLQEISLSQQKQVRDIFNIDIWSKTWLDVINKVSNSD